jgi:hypothetical protein
LTVPGHGADEDLIDAVLVEDRVFTLEESGILPGAIVQALADSWDREGMVGISVVEDWLEGLPDLVQLDCKTWGAVCLFVCPELYGEPPRCLKSSDGVPRSKAMMAALQRRWQSKTQLRNEMDSHGIGWPIGPQHG